MCIWWSLTNGLCTEPGAALRFLPTQPAPNPHPPPSSYGDRGQCGSSALPFLVPHTYFKVSRSFLIFPMPSCPALLYYFSPPPLPFKPSHRFLSQQVFLGPLAFPPFFPKQLLVWALCTPPHHNTPLSSLD